MVYGLGFMVYGLRFTVYSSGFRVQGLGFRIHGYLERVGGVRHIGEGESLLVLLAHLENVLRTLG